MNSVNNFPRDEGDNCAHLERLLSQTSAKEIVLQGRFAAAKSIDTILDMVRFIFEAHGIANVRFYSTEWIGGKKVLVSVACSGHDSELRRQFASGSVVHRFIKESESTLCFDYKPNRNKSPLGTPVVVRAHANVAALKQIGSIEGEFPVFEAPDNCRGLLRNSGEERLYVDFPVMLAGKPMGKFSCDFCASDLEMVSRKSLEKCHAIAQAAGAAIASIARSRERRTLVQCVKEVRSTPSAAATHAFEAMVQEHLHCANMHFFPILKCSTSPSEEDELPSKLFLSHSTFDAFRMYEHSGNAYSLNSNKLIAIAARSRHALRFNDVGKPEARNEQAVRYGVEIDWDNDWLLKWNEYSAVMVIPVIDPVVQEPLGVMVFTQRLEDGRFFSFEHERLAKLLVRSVFSRIISRKQAVPQSSEPNRFAEFAFDLSKRFHLDCNPIEVTIEVLKKLVPETSTKGKRLYAVCTTSYSKQRNSLVVLGCAGQLSPNPRVIKKRYALEGSITEDALRKQPRDVVFRVLDVKFPKEVARTRKPYTQGAVFAMAIAFENQVGESIGSILVKSDQFDLEPNELGPYLRVLSYWLSKHPKIAQAMDGSSLHASLQADVASKGVSQSIASNLKK